MYRLAVYNTIVLVLSYYLITFVIQQYCLYRLCRGDKSTILVLNKVMCVVVPKVYGGVVSWLGGVIVKVAHLVLKCTWFSITTLVCVIVKVLWLVTP